MLSDILPDVSGADQLCPIRSCPSLFWLNVQGVWSVNPPEKCPSWRQPRAQVNPVAKSRGLLRVSQRDRHLLVIPGDTRHALGTLLLINIGFPVVPQMEVSPLQSLLDQLGSVGEDFTIPALVISMLFTVTKQLKK